MYKIPNNIRPYFWSILLVGIAGILIGLIITVFPPWLQPVAWILSVIMTVIITFFLQFFIPPDVKDSLEYRINRVKKRISNPEVTVTLAANYSLIETTGLADLSGEFQQVLAIAPNSSGEVFKTEEFTELGELHKTIHLDWSPIIVDQAGGVQQEARQVTNIRVKIRGKTTYKRLSQMLLATYQRQNNIQTIFSPIGIDEIGYSIDCQLNEPILIDRLMSRFEVDTLQAQSDEGIDVEFWEDKIRVRNSGGEEELYTMFDTIQKIVTYYG